MLQPALVKGEQARAMTDAHDPRRGEPVHHERYSRASAGSSSAAVASSINSHGDDHRFARAFGRAARGRDDRVTAEIPCEYAEPAPARSDRRSAEIDDRFHDKPFKDVCRHLSLGKKVTPKAMRRTFQDLARRAAVDGLVQRSICGHLTEEMTERYSSVAQVEVEAALGKVVSLAGYRDLLGGASSGARDGGKAPSGGKVVGNDVGATGGSGAGELQPTAIA
jgi:hypothetical protein